MLVEAEPNASFTFTYVGDFLGAEVANDLIDYVFYVASTLESS